MSGVGQTSGMVRMVDVGSASLFAGAAGYSALLLASPAAGVAAAAIAFVGAHQALGRIDRQPRFALPEFAVDTVEAEEDELLLTELTELLLTETVAIGDELLLDDPLDQPAPDSRVIRLFDPRTLPTAGNLHDRIERHLQRPSPAYPDATSELHEALSALKSSLR
jgi:hypothetical protein